MNGTARATPYGYSLWEFQVFGVIGGGGGCPTTNVAQGRPATASSAENATFAAPNAFDGNAATRWSSAFSDPQWIQVDLGSTRSICQVVLSWEAAFARVVPDPGLRRRRATVDEHLHHDDGYGRHADPDRERHPVATCG